MNVLSIIPARGGSKGLKKKNILDLCGKPLIAWTIEASLKSQYITQTIVSSDDDNIIKIVHQYNADTIKRPFNLSLDNTATEDVIKHTLESFSKESFDYIILLQPTSPLRTYIDIDKAFQLFLSTQATALISVCEIDNKILKAFKKDSSNYLKPISNKTYPFMRRQELPSTYLSNGAIYIIKTSQFIKDYSLFTNETIPYIMNQSNSIDIDTQEDLEEAKNIITE